MAFLLVLRQDALVHLIHFLVQTWNQPFLQVLVSFKGTQCIRATLWGLELLGDCTLYSEPTILVLKDRKADRIRISHHLL